MAADDRLREVADIAELVQDAEAPEVREIDGPPDSWLYRARPIWMVGLLPA